MLVKQTPAMLYGKPVVLVLRGGGALGSYHIGVYQALAERSLTPSWVVGTAIGAINGAILCGNPANTRLTQLADFWRALADTGYWGAAQMPDDVRRVYGFWYAMGAMLTRYSESVAFRQHDALTGDARHCARHAGPHTVTPLRATLQRLIDFELLNKGPIRLLLGALHVTAGKVFYCDNARWPIAPEHVMASAALPPFFAAMAKNGSTDWDKAIDAQLSPRATADDQLYPAGLCCIVDLWDPYPRTSSMISFPDHHAALVDRGSYLAEKVDNTLNDPGMRWPGNSVYLTNFRIIRLVYPDQTWIRAEKHADFSWAATEAHWAQGYLDATQALEQVAPSKTILDHPLCAAIR